MKPDFRALVARHARATGAPNLALHTVDELAAHLEEIYLAARADGRSEAEALAAAEHALAESPLAAVPRSRVRAPESRPWSTPEPGGRLMGLSGDLRFALRQLRRAPGFAA